MVYQCVTLTDETRGQRPQGKNYNPHTGDTFVVTMHLHSDQVCDSYSRNYR